MIKISRDKLPRLLDALNQDAPLFLPVKKVGKVNFAKMQPGAVVDFDTLKTVNSAKDLFFPPSEGLYTSAITNDGINISPMPFPEEKFIVFGIRACDLNALPIIDNVYLKEPVDHFYKSRREAAVLISLACNKPGMTCFCTAFGLDPANPQGDVQTYMDDAFVYWHALTEKGKQLTEKVQALFDHDAGCADHVKDEIKKNVDALPYKTLPLKHFSPEDLLKLFNSNQWNRLHQACLECGTCTFLCPTCYCYDISEFDNGNEVTCHRCWDSCMYTDFTLMAHGNPRPTHKQRYRQRFMHKLVYYPETYDGTIQCVGCGRCVNKCPVNLNIVKIIKQLDKMSQTPVPSLSDESPISDFNFKGGTK